MTKKIFHSILQVSIITFLCCIILLIGIVCRYFNDRLQRELENEAEFVCAGVEQDGLAYLNSLQADSRITWIDSEGNVLFDSVKEEGEPENHSNREEIREALENGRGESRRYSATLAVKNMYYAIRLSDGSVVRVSTTQYSAWALLLGMVYPMILVLVIVLLISVALATTLSRKIVKPINEIDIENPSIGEDYEELSPLLHKISRQNHLIRLQMNDLRRRQEEFRTFTENMSEGLILIDDKAEVLFYNSSALRQLGAEGAAFGKSVLTLNCSDEFCSAVNGALDGQRSEPIVEVDGKSYQLLANPVRVEGAVNGAVLVILDVTEREQRDAMRREFTSNVSHELKTPLTSIYGISEMMVNGMVRPEDMHTFAKNIYDESGRMIALIEDIIRLSRLDESSVAEEKETTDLFVIAGDVVKRLSHVAGERGILLHLTGEPCSMWGIPSVLSEMVYNLCDNAIKYNKDAGEVFIDVSHCKGHVVLQVRDTGIGIPKEHLDRVFERFYRVDKSHSRAIGGTGLGLSIVKHGAAYHGAEISIESHEGEGTSVKVQF